MKQTRRRFLGAAGAIVAAAGVRPSAATGQGVSTTRPAGAPGVELKLDEPSLPDYSHDLERYLVRLTREARDRRKRVVDAIGTPAQVAARQKSAVRDLWTMLGGPLERTPLNPRVTGVVERVGYRIEKLIFESRPRLYVTANLYVP